MWLDRMDIDTSYRRRESGQVAMGTNENTEVFFDRGGLLSSSVRKGRDLQEIGIIFKVWSPATTRVPREPVRVVSRGGSWACRRALSRKCQSFGIDIQDQEILRQLATQEGRYDFEGSHETLPCRTTFF